MYYHASPVKEIKILEPRISNHEIPLVYFSKKRENVLVYLSNAVEKYCKDTGFVYEGIWKKWGPYGFNKDGTLRIEEYCPNMLELTYKGVSGYIYSADEVKDSGFELQIPDAVTSCLPVPITNAEFVEDAYDAIAEAEEQGLLTIIRFENMPKKMKEWIKRIIPEEYAQAKDHPEYRHFLKGNFPDLLKTDVIGKTVKGIIDRPIGSRHPRYPEMVYPLNYGYVEGVFSGDGAQQDVYVLGTDEPLSAFEGTVIAVYHRINDVEDKWIVSLDGRDYSDDEILRTIQFQEQYFDGTLIR